MTRVALAACTLASVAAFDTGQQAQFRTSVERVRLEVRVIGASGPIAGLEADDFVVHDNGVAQSIEVTEAGDAPLDLVLVAQPIESVAYVSPGHASLVSAGLSAFLAQVTDADRLAALLAGSPPSRLRKLEYGRPTFDARAFAGGVYAAPFDAIVGALDQFDRSDRAQALVVFTNAADFRSTTRFEDVAVLTRRRGPAFVIVGTPVRIRETARVKAAIGSGSVIRDSGLVAEAAVSGDVFPATLRLLADRTGGITVNLADGEPGQVIAGMFAWLRTRYTITYEPPAAKGWHSVKITVSRKDATVRAREGYFVD